MRTTAAAVVIVSLCCVLSAMARVAPLNAPNSPDSRIWAVLIAGSNGFSNYRHQSDLCRSYHALHARGIPDNQTIVFMYDDIANARSNPFKGQIFNDYSHENVYAGVPKDYTGDAVDPQVFLKVLTGIAPNVGSNRVLESNENDRVFVFFDDHGGDGILGFPNAYLRHDPLAKALQTMADKKMYGKMVFYIEACEAGSMFYDLSLPSDMYVVTASPITASSFAWQYDSAVGTYLADVMAQAWVNQTEMADDDGFTFQEGYEYLTTHIDNGSQPCQYGDLSFASELNINDFFGTKRSSSTLRHKVQQSVSMVATEANGAVPTREASYEAAKRRVAENPTMDNIESLKMEEMVHARVDNALHNILVAAGLEDGMDQIEVPCPDCSPKCKCMTGCGQTAECKFECCNLQSCHKRYSLSKQGEQCSQALVRAWQDQCGNSNDYLRTGDNVLSRACRLRTGDKINISAALEAIFVACPLII